MIRWCWESFSRKNGSLRAARINQTFAAIFSDCSHFSSRWTVQMCICEAGDYHASAFGVAGSSPGEIRQPDQKYSHFFAEFEDLFDDWLRA
jgi:hypothetical protein